jgi:hypothetical protein
MKYQVIMGKDDFVLIFMLSLIGLSNNSNLRLKVIFRLLI